MQITESQLCQIIREELLNEIEPELEELTNPATSESLWSNVHKRRAAGKKPKRPGQKGYPKTLDVD